MAWWPTLKASTQGKKAPIIVAATTASNGQELQVEGYFFQSSGQVRIDGTAVETSLWSDGSLVATLPANLQSGSHVLSVSTADGLDKLAFSYSSQQSKPELYERELATPNFDAQDVRSLYGELGISLSPTRQPKPLSRLVRGRLVTNPTAKALIASGSWQACHQPDSQSPYRVVSYSFANATYSSTSLPM